MDLFVVRLQYGETCQSSANALSDTYKGPTDLYDTQDTFSAYVRDHW